MVEVEVVMSLDEFFQKYEESRKSQNEALLKKITESGAKQVKVTCGEVEAILDIGHAGANSRGVLELVLFGACVEKHFD